MDSSRTRGKSGVGRKPKREKVTDKNRCCCLHDGIDIYVEDDFDDEPYLTDDELYAKMMQLKDSYMKQLEIFNHPTNNEDTKVRNGRPRSTPLPPPIPAAVGNGIKKGVVSGDSEVSYTRQYDYLDDYIKGLKSGPKASKQKTPNVLRESVKSKPIPTPPPVTQPATRMAISSPPPEPEATPVKTPVEEKRTNSSATAKTVQSRSVDRTPVEKATPVQTKKQGQHHQSSTSTPHHTPTTHHRGQNRPVTPEPTSLTPQATNHTTTQQPTAQQHQQHQQKETPVKVDSELQSLIEVTITQLDSSDVDIIFDHLTKGTGRRQKQEIAHLSKESLREAIRNHLATRSANVKKLNEEAKKLEQEQQEPHTPRALHPRRVSSSRSGGQTNPPPKTRPESTSKKASAQTEHIAEDKCPVCKRQYQKDEKASEDDKAYTIDD
eukprot:TRINITY_DN4034_c0_g2_i2.p1 TRINITY_DN4034_c0_g2~~TRINITY_DN4034_c0_g2_i2.p1  ORF type:complete len:435 (+),score=95.55 TRINITY_DN4034_c0_g2_i2:94-1398(+)